MRRIFTLLICVSLLAVTPAYAGKFINVGGSSAGSGTLDSDLITIGDLVCTDGQVIKRASGAWACGTDVTGGSGGGGGVSGPGSATDNAVVRFDSTTGGIVQNSSVTIADNGDIVTPGKLTVGTGSTAGVIALVEGTAPGAAPANTVLIHAPVDVTTAYKIVLPAASSSGFLKGTNASNVNTLSFATITDSDIPNSITIDLAATATALAANPANCSAGQAAAGVSATGVAEGCFIPSGGGGTGTIFSTDCQNEEIASGGFCMETVTPFTVYYCPLPSGDCEDPGDIKPLPTDDLDTGVHNLTEAWQGGKGIIGADSESNAFYICTDNSVPADGDCNDPGDMSIKMFCNPATGCTILTKPDGDNVLNAPAGFDVVIKLGGMPVARFDHTTSKLTYLNSGQPLNSVELLGKPFGTCVYTEATVATSKPIVGTFTCAADNNSGFDFDTVMPINWNASTVTVRLNAYSVNGAPTGNILLHCSGQSVRDNDVIQNKSATGEKAVTLSLATQYREENATSSAITIQGTKAGGAHLYMHCDVDASGSTATMADVRINAKAKLFYTVTSVSE